MSTQTDSVLLAQIVALTRFCGLLSTYTLNDTNRSNFVKEIDAMINEADERLERLHNKENLPMQEIEVLEAKRNTLNALLSWTEGGIQNAPDDDRRFGRET